MSNSTYGSVQFDASGNEIDTTLSESLSGKKPEGSPAAAALDVNKLNASLRQASYEISGGAQIDDNLTSEATQKMAMMDNEIERLMNVAASGSHIVAPTEIDNLINGKNDIVATLAKVTRNDPESLAMLQEFNNKVLGATAFINQQNSFKKRSR